MERDEKYILNERLALREWNDNRNTYGLLKKRADRFFRLSKNEFEFLKLADGITEIPVNVRKSEVFQRLIDRKIIHKVCGWGQLTDWQKYHYYDNPNYNTVSLRLTGRCNYNCKHCFNAADVNTDNAQWSYAEAEKLVNEAAECGIRMFRLTGGEPMLHPDFLKIFKLIAEKGMIPGDILTNGAFITQEMLDEIKKVNKHVTFVISFDCLHHHDWMRGKEGCENKTIEAIRLCVENGFKVLLNVQVNRITMDSLVETAEFFDALGVQTFRFIRTTETPRWRNLAGDATLFLEEYYDVCVNFLKRYYAKEHKMNIICWQFGWFDSSEKKYEFGASRCDVEKYSDDIYSCGLNAYTVSLGANGNMYPCHQISGQYDYMGWKLPNVKKVGLREGLKNKKFLHDTRVTWGEIAKVNKKCKECPHFRQCGGGCRACAVILSNNDFFGCDPYMCSFYKGNYSDRVSDVLIGWTVRFKPVNYKSN